MPRWKRVVLKISGEAFAGGSSSDAAETIDAATVQRIAQEIASCAQHGVEIAVVVGGGNIWRGATAERLGMDRATADHMGMLGTVINALALQDALERKCGQQTRVQSAITMAEVAEPFIRRRAVRHLEKGRVVIFAAGMGNPFFTTDTPAALRAVEIGAEVLMKGTHGGVDGVYTADPRVDSTATKLDRASYQDVITKELRVMDLTAFTLCKENELPILVFDISTDGNLRRAIDGEPIGTLIG